MIHDVHEPSENVAIGNRTQPVNVFETTLLVSKEIRHQNHGTCKMRHRYVVPENK